MSSLDRFFGGPPVRTLLWLAAVSVAIGFVLTTLRIHPLGLVNGVIEFVRDIVGWLRYLGADLVGAVWQWFVYGAIVVVPVWLVMRLLAMGKGRG